MIQAVYDLLNLFFPDCCRVCGTPLPRPGMVLCLKCELGLPRAYYTKLPDNPVARIFWGRVRVQGATSLFRFEKGSRYQKLLHRLKYKGEQEIGLFLGRLLGEDLAGSLFTEPRYIVPVPLHPDKLKIRGYNQSELLATGIAEITGQEVVNGVLERSSFTETQTRKGRYDRFTNVAGKFVLSSSSETYREENLLLIDDIVTTGATLEACASPLTEELGAKVYIATIGCA